MNKGQLLGEGRSCQVYEWAPGTVLKLYYDWWPLRSIEYEARVGTLLVEAGIPAPAPGEIVEVEGRRGLVYERAEGPSMQTALEQHPEEAERFALLLARLHAAIHKPLAAPLPMQQEAVTRAIELVPGDLLSADLKQKALERLDSLPQGQLLCHGDFHPGNVLLGSRTPRIIDWENACLGSPAADAARTALLFSAAHLHYPAAERTEALTQIFQSFREVYLGEYLRLMGLDRAVVEAWQVPLAAARMAEGIEEENDFLIALIRKG